MTTGPIATATRVRRSPERFTLKREVVMGFVLRAFLIVLIMIAASACTSAGSVDSCPLSDYVWVEQPETFEGGWYVYAGPYWIGPIPLCQSPRYG
jgi:hypothetical protein